MYVLAKTLWNDRSDFDALAQAYFGAAFGPDGEACRAYMARLSHLFDPTYLRTGTSRRASHGNEPVLNPSAARKLSAVPQEINAFRPVIERNMRASEACWAQSWTYLSYHTTLATLLAAAFQARAEGRLGQARERWNEAADFVQRNEDALQPVLDVFEFVRTLGRLFG